MMRKLAIDEDRVIELYEKYENAREVCAEIGCSDQTVYRILGRHGIKRTHRHPKQRVFVSQCKTKYCPALVFACFQLGIAREDIAELLGVSYSNVYNTLRYRYNVEPYQRPNLDTIEREYIAGATTYELGKKYNVNHTLISKWMRKRGHCRGKGNPRGNYHQERVSAFLSEFPDRLDACKDADSRYMVRRMYRIVSRPHDGPITGLTWKDVYEHNGHDLTCWICRKKCIPNGEGDIRPSIDHVVPLSNGGTDTYDNVQIAHCGCNRDRNNKVQLTLDFMVYEKGAKNAEEQTFANQCT